MTTLRRAAEWLAAGLGSGWLPRAPGTWGSLAALWPGWWLWRQGEGVLLGAVIGITLLGCAVCAVVLPTLEEQDPGWIVIDEWAGQWLTIAVAAPFVALSWPWLIACFIAFRLFDITKPWPIRRLEHAGPAWWSIIADDLAAALMAGGVVAVATGFSAIFS